MTALTIALLIIAGMITMVDWRKGLAACVILGIAQDPLRKLAPGQPVFYVLLVGVMFAMTWVRAALARVRLGPSVIKGWRDHLNPPFAAFIALVIFQAFHTYIRYGSAFMAGIGLLVWLSPLPAVLLSYQFATRRGIRGVQQWMLIYVLVAMVGLSGVYFEYAGFQWRTLGEIGEGQIIYDLGTVLKAHSGFFRASETAAWHTATIACFVFMLSLGKRPTVLRVASALALIALLVSLGILTGRRKMLVEITIFLCCYGFLVAWLQRGMARLAMVLVAMGFAGYILIVGFVSPDLVQTSATKSMSVENAQRIQGYAARGRSVIADLPARVKNLGFEPVISVIDEFGWLGAGLGTGSQGTNQIAESNGINRWAAEGGLGKVAMELGIPGLAVVVWLLVALFAHLRQQLTIVAQLSTQHMRIAYGIAAFLVANAATFTVAAQAYSDLFILLILGWCTGFLLAMPELAARGDGRRPNRARTGIPDAVAFGHPADLSVASTRAPQ